LYEGIIKYHNVDKGVVDYVDFRTGKPYTNICNVKRALLSLKLYISKENFGRIYENQNLFDLLRDR
jgi:hypothetical protein